MTKTNDLPLRKKSIDESSKKSDTQTKPAGPERAPPRKWQSNGLMVKGSPDGVEPVFTYTKGGNLPVHIHSQLGKYRVVHKLGFGNSSNIWLCRDTKSDEPMYFAIKVLYADAPTDNPDHWIGLYFETTKGKQVNANLCLPLEYLDIHGPNGTSHLIVYPLLGPTLVSLFRMRSDTKGVAMMRDMCHQVVHAVVSLHKCNICHGAIRTENVLVDLKGVHGRSEDEIRNDIGWPTTRDVVTFAGEKNTEPSAPNYLVPPVNWEFLRGNAIHISQQAFLIDYSSAYVKSEPPETLDTPLEYSSPEWLLDKKVGIGSDIWGLGCVLYEIRTGVHIFRNASSYNDYLTILCKILGKMPEPWWSDTWKPRKTYLEGDVNSESQVVFTPTFKDGHMSRGISSIKKNLEVVFKATHPKDDRWLPLPFDDTELDLFSDLLEKIFKWRPEERLTAHEIMEHPWFRFGLCLCSA